MKTICKLEDLKKTGVIGDNIKSYCTDGVIYNIERQVLTPVLSKKLYEQLMIQLANNNVTPLYAKLIDEYILYAVAYRLKSELMIELSFDLKSSGVSQNTSERTSIITLKDVKELQSNYIEKSKWYMDEMTTYILSNEVLFPEYMVAETPDDIVVSIDKYKCPINFRHRKGCR